MIKNNYIIFILLISFCFQSCLEPNQEVSDRRKKEILDSINLEINQYEFKSDIEYLKYFNNKEKDSLISDWVNLKLNTKENKQKRYNEISSNYVEIYRLQNWAKENFVNEDPYYNRFKRYLLPEELKSLNPKSISQLKKYNELWKKRYSLIKEKLPTNYRTHTYSSKKILSNSEIHEFIRDSFKLSPYLKNYITNSKKKDSITYWTRYYNHRDSLQNTIHPIDSILPFGPKPLGELIKNNKNYLNFYVKKGNSLIEEKKQDRKTVYDTWMYFLKLHPDADADLSEDYEEKLLPPIKTYQNIELSSSRFTDKENYNPINSGFNLRLPNIGKYELYYSTTAYDYPYACDVHGKKEEDCCYGEDYFCESTGYLIFYDRDEQHSVTIDAFELGYGGTAYRLDLRFFYIKENIIHIFEGNNAVKKANYRDEISFLSYTKKIEIHADGEFVVKDVCLFKDRYDNLKTLHGHSKYDQMDVLVKKTKEKHEQSYNNYRDSILKSHNPIIKSYPLGSPVLSSHKFPKQTFTAKTHHKKMLDSILTYKYKPAIDNFSSSIYILPIPEKIKEIELGEIEIWNNELLESHYRTSYCWEDFDSDYEGLYRYKLPSINDIDVYYSFFQNQGVLTFYNTETQTATVINALYIKDSWFRVFYINKNNQIEVFQGLKNKNSNNNTENIYKITKTHIIEVTPDNEIKVILETKQ